MSKVQVERPRKNHLGVKMRLRNEMFQKDIVRIIQYTNQNLCYT